MKRILGIALIHVSEKLNVGAFDIVCSSFGVKTHVVSFCWIRLSGCQILNLREPVIGALWQRMEKHRKVKSWMS